MELHTFRSRNQLEENGEYYVACSGPPGAGLATDAAPIAYDETKAFVLLRNNAPAGGRSLYPDCVKLVCVTPGTGGTACRLTAGLHDDRANSKWVSGGSALTPMAVSGGLGGPGSALIRAGALVTTAGADARILTHAVFRSAIPVALDEYTLHFGLAGRSHNLSATGGATALKMAGFAPAVKIPPGWVMPVYLWLPGQSAASSWEVEVGYWEGPQGRERRSKEVDNGEAVSVQCLPQRGFSERRRAGILFTAEGTVIRPEQLTSQILGDPGLRVIELPEGARIYEAGEFVPWVADPAQEARCAFVKANGERCKGEAKDGESLCRDHKAKGSEGAAAGATVTQL